MNSKVIDSEEVKTRNYHADYKHNPKTVERQLERALPHVNLRVVRLGSQLVVSVQGPHWSLVNEALEDILN